MKEQFTHQELVALWKAVDGQLIEQKRLGETLNPDLQSSFKKLDCYIRDHADEDTLELIPSDNG